MTVIVEFAVVPLETDEKGLDDTVSVAVKEVKKLCENKGYHWELNSMGTIIEGDSLKEIFSILEQTIEAAFEIGNSRISTIIKIDDRRDIEGLRGKKKIKTVLDNIQ